MVSDISDKLHECSICKAKYNTHEEAEECEESHRIKTPELADI